MNIRRRELEHEMVSLSERILTHRKNFDEGLKTNRTLAELKPIYPQIKDLKKRLEFCFEEAHAMGKMSRIATSF